jgi:hypothetical protein
MVGDTGNEHFLAFNGPAGLLMAAWTQGSAEAQPGQHLAFARSTDEGATRTKLRIIAGPKKAGDGFMASRGYRLASRSGRICVLYSQHIGKFDTFYDHTGWLHGIFSDDDGQTWSQPQDIPVARSIHDNPDPSSPPNMPFWQKSSSLGSGASTRGGSGSWGSRLEARPPRPGPPRRSTCRMSRRRPGMAPTARAGLGCPGVPLGAAGC